MQLPGSKNRDLNHYRQAREPPIPVEADDDPHRNYEGMAPFAAKTKLFE